MSQVGTPSTSVRPVAGTASAGAAPLAATPTDQAAGQAPRRDGAGGQQPHAQGGHAAPAAPPHAGPAVTISGALTALFDGQPVAATVVSSADGQIVLRLPEARLIAALQSLAAEAGDQLIVKLVTTDPAPEVVILSRNGQPLPETVPAGVTIEPIAEPITPGAALIALRRAASASQSSPAPAPASAMPIAAAQSPALPSSPQPAAAPSAAATAPSHGPATSAPAVAPLPEGPDALRPPPAPTTAGPRPTAAAAMPASASTLATGASAAPSPHAAAGHVPPALPTALAIPIRPAPTPSSARVASAQTAPVVATIVQAAAAQAAVAQAAVAQATAIQVPAIQVPAPFAAVPASEAAPPSFDRPPEAPTADGGEPPIATPIRQRPPPLVLPELTPEPAPPARPVAAGPAPASPPAPATQPLAGEMPAATVATAGAAASRPPANAAEASRPAAGPAAPASGTVAAAPDDAARAPLPPALPPIEIEPLPPPDAPAERRAASAWQALWATARTDGVVADHLREMLEPRAGGRLGGGLAFLVTALRGGGLRSFLGADEAVRVDRPTRAHGSVRTTASEFRDLAQIAQERMADGWRAAPLAVLDGGMIQPVMLYVHRPPRRRKSDPDPSESAQRFMLDLKLSRTGPLRIDGLLRPKALDVIVRTERSVPARVQQELRQVFTASLDGSGLGGSLNFQRVDRLPPPPGQAATAKPHQAVLA